MDDVWVRRYVEWMGLSGYTARTVESRSRLLARLGDRLGKPIGQATEEELNSWQLHLLDRETAGQLKPASRHTYVKYVREFYAWLVGEDLVPARNPARVLVLPQLPRTMPQPIRDDDLERALAQATSDRLRVWLLLACLCGLRVCEIAAVSRADVMDHRDPRWLLVHGKGAKERAVPLPDIVLWALRPFLGQRGRLFWLLDGTASVSPGLVDHAVNNHLHGLGIDATAHSLRKWFATNVYELSDKDSLLTAALLGHELVSTIATYVRWDQGRAAPVVSQLAKLIAI